MKVLSNIEDQIVDHNKGTYQAAKEIFGDDGGTVEKDAHYLLAFSIQKTFKRNNISHTENNLEQCCCVQRSNKFSLDTGFLT